VKLQIKVLVSILATIVVIVAVTRVVELWRSTDIARASVAQSLKHEEDLQWEVAERVLKAIETAMLVSMAAGDMDSLEKVVAAQKGVKGVLELSLHGNDGKVVT
jgi:hypothetical protein